MVLRYATVVLAAAFLATVAALSISAVEPTKADVMTTTVVTCDGATIELRFIEKKVVDLHNEARMAYGLPPLCIDPTLTEAARAHSADMIARNYFGHGAVGARLSSFGYPWIAYGENIAGGSGSFAAPVNIFDMWMGSPGHHANIMNGNFEEVGVGAVTGEYNGFALYTMYTADFGTTR
jgi:uncharacterized protein YkwD